MKKFIPILVLWVFLSGSGGYFFVFKIMQFVNYCKIENEITNRNKDVIRQVLVFNAGEDTCLKWIKKQKEFIYNGQMYDVEKIISFGKKVHYYCINDTKEKRLIAAFEKRNRSSGQSNQLIRKITQSQFILSTPPFRTFRQIFECWYSQPVWHYLSPINNTLSPPPEQIRIT